MPAGTKVYRCVQKLKEKYGKVIAIKICQKSTGLAYKTGKPTKRSKSKRKKHGK